MDEGDSWVEADGPPSPHVVVPWRELSAEALRGVIVEYVTREGTEYGLSDVPLETKIEQVHGQLERAEVLVLWDAKTETVNLATRRELER